MRGLWLIPALMLAACAASLVRAQAPAGVLAMDALSDVDKLRIENANLYDLLATYVEEADTCRGQLAKPRAEANRGAAGERRAKLKAEIEHAHPGFSWDPATGALTPKPAAEKP